MIIIIKKMKSMLLNSHLRASLLVSTHVEHMRHHSVWPTWLGSWFHFNFFILFYLTMFPRLRDFMVFIFSVLASVFWNSFKRLKISYRASALKIFVRHKKFRNWEISYLLGKNNQILLAVHIFKIDWKLMMLIMKESFYHPCGNNNCQANSEEDWSTCDGKVGYSWNLFTLSLHIYQESFPAYTKKVSLHIWGKGQKK